jgi:hypothetical protein
MSDRALGALLLGGGLGYGAKRLLEEEQPTMHSIARGYIPRSLV